MRALQKRERDNNKEWNESTQHMYRQDRAQQKERYYKIFKRRVYSFIINTNSMHRL